MSEWLSEWVVLSVKALCVCVCVCVWELDVSLTSLSDLTQSDQTVELLWQTSSTVTGHTATECNSESVWCLTMTWILAVHWFTEVCEWLATWNVVAVHGCRDLFWLPVEQYRRDGRLVRGFQRGAQSFMTCTAMSTLELTNRVVQTIQVDQPCVQCAHHSCKQTYFLTYVYVSGFSSIF